MLSITNTTSRPIEVNNTMHNGPYLVAITQNYSNKDLLFALRCLPLNQLWCFGLNTSNQYIISHENSTKLSIQSNGNTTISGELDVGSVTIDAGSYKMGKISVGDTTPYETFNGLVNGFNLNPQTQMSFVACAHNDTSNVNHIGLCCLNRAAGHNSYTPAITFSAWGLYYGAELNHIGAIACQQRAISKQRHLEGDMVFFTKDSTGSL